MSYQGQTWVDEVALPYLLNSGELLVMLRVANHAGNGRKKMSGCTASAKTLAAECLMGRSTVLNHLRKLSERGLLIPGDPALVAHLPADRRPPVYDLAGAHDYGCIGGHTYIADCETTGAEIQHPQKKPRSAGAKSQHSQPEGAGTGAEIRTGRVLKSSTKSSKDLKESSLSGGGSPSNADGATSAGLGGEREEAPTSNDAPPSPSAEPFGNETETDRQVNTVIDAYLAAYMATAGLPPRPQAIKEVRAGAAALLSVGRTVENLALLAAQMGGKGWTDLVRHAQMNPEAPPASGVRKPWCGECNDGREPASAAERMVDTDSGLAKCQCHPGYVPTQPVQV